MIYGLTLLLLCQLAGETLAFTFTLPVPGPVLGLVCLAVVLHIAHRRRADAGERLEAMSVTRVSDALLANLSLLFVPAGVGIIDQLGVLRAEGLTLTLVLLVSTVLTLLVTVGTFIGVARLLRGGTAQVQP